MKITKKRYLGVALIVCAAAAVITVASCATKRGVSALSGLDPETELTGELFSALLDEAMEDAAPETIDLAEGEIVTREAAVRVLAGLIGLDTAADPGDALSAFTDQAEISEGSRGAVGAMAGAGYVTPDADGRFNPGESLTVSEGRALISAVGDALPYVPRNLSGRRTVYGTATLSYADYYAGDVTSLAGYGVDGVSSATVGKHTFFNNGMYTNYTPDRTDGYNILGVQNVNVAIAARDALSYAELNPTFRFKRTAPNQYKTITMEGGRPVYSATHFNTVDTITDANYELLTDATWGDYQINVLETSTSYIRNTRNGEFAINDHLQGIILETQDGFKAGLEYMQSIWVQPYEISFNVTEESTNNGHIASWDNIEELSKLEGETLASVTYIMPDSAYVYTFEGIYFRPFYKGDAHVSAAFDGDGETTLSIEGIPEDLEDVTVTVTQGTGHGRQTVASKKPVVNGKVTMDRPYDSAQTYTVKVSSSNYADIEAVLPMSDTQREQLTRLVSRGRALLEGAAAGDSALRESVTEAERFLSQDGAASTAAAAAVSSLTNLVTPYLEPAAAQ